MVDGWWRDTHSDVQPETVAEPVQQRAHPHFRSRVLPPNPAHIPRTALAREMVFALTLDPSPNRLAAAKPFGRARWARERCAALFGQSVPHLTILIVILLAILIPRIALGIKS